VSWQIAPVVQLIKDHLSKGPNNIAVVGNEGIKKGDRLPQNVSLFRFFGTEVYNLLLPDSDESLISTSIQGGRNPWRAPGVLTSVAQEEKEELRNVETLTLSTLEGFVDGTTTVFAAAYDEWGFVIWKRRVS
jgi:hypothetical protein